MLGLLFLLFVAVPIAELAILVRLAGEMGLGATVALILVTGFAGAALAKWQGLRVVRRLREELGAGRMPADAMFEGVLLLVAGAFLVTPGVITDAVGFLLLVPFFRRWLGRRVRAWAGKRFKVVTFGPGPAGGSPIKDAEEVTVRDTAGAEERREE